MSSTNKSNRKMASEENSIYEDMVSRERRQLALELGCRIPDLEEIAALEQGILDSTAEAAAASNQRGAAACARTIDSKVSQLQNEPPLETAAVVVETEEDEATGTLFLEKASKGYNDSCENRLSPEQRRASPWWLLPPEMADRICELIGDPDCLGLLCCLAKTNGLGPSEMAYKQMAHQLYPRQFGPRTGLNVANWGHSWRSLLINRPRIRVNGFYTLKTMFTKAPTNDSFDDPKIVGSIETVYYRHFRFFNDGRVLYSPSLLDPWEIKGQMARAKAVDKAVYQGSYAAKGRNVSVTLRLHYCTILFDLEILDGCDSYSNYPGKHSVLRIVKHSQTLPGPPGAPQEECYFPLPLHRDCRFWRDWSFLPSQEFPDNKKSP